ncbi:amidohydrolase [Aestuariibius sp. HNIBRBA575]|uniref:amidohydrolase family protein n=1 Tax=Aestuariibius sp. HNIBRBA575 TaxID=3233343 RepID=UPI0034A18EFF
MTTHFSITDAHVHVFLPEKYPLTQVRSYTPGPANVADLEAHLERIGAKNVVIVQPSPHGIDNRPSLTAVQDLGRDRAKCVCVIDPKTTTKEDVKALADLGVCGLRANLKTAGIDAIDNAAQQLRDLDRVMMGTDLILQVFLPVHVNIALAPLFKSLGRPVILDHFAGLKTSSPTLDTDMAGLADVLSASNVFLKVSGACRVTDYAATAVALDDFAPDLFATARGRVIWGSDWPHTGKSAERAKRPLSEVEPFLKIDDQKGLKDIQRWSENNNHFQEITKSTADDLFGF